jgi:hypothetical protein
MIGRMNVEEWMDHMEFLSLPGGKHRLFCPVSPCTFAIECDGFQASIQLKEHIENEHPESVSDIYYDMHPGSQPGQKTLEAF